MDKYTLPIYLNQKYVFDLLAIIEDGFSQVETIKTGQSETNSDKDNLKGEIGISNVFAFLKFGLSADVSTENTNNSNQETSKEKIHTPNSLFSKMRTFLHSEKMIVKEDFLNAQTGQFIEIQLSLRKNPIIDILEGFHSLMKMAVSFEEKKTTPVNKNHNKIEESPNQKILNQIDSLLNQLKDEGSLDLVGMYTFDENIQVVLTLDKGFMGELSISDIADGHFSVLGKITRIIKTKNDGDVNLLRKTSLSKLNQDMIDQMFSGFAQLEEFGIQNQLIETKIEGPVIQLIPIAIFT
jgi:hypothetical protein